MARTRTCRRSSSRQTDIRPPTCQVSHRPFNGPFEAKIPSHSGCLHIGGSEPIYPTGLAVRLRGPPGTRCSLPPRSPSARRPSPIRMRRPNHRAAPSASRSSRPASRISSSTSRAPPSSGYIHQLYAELEAKGISLRPAVLPVRSVGLPVRRAGDRHPLLPGGPAAALDRGGAGRRRGDGARDPHVPAPRGGARLQLRLPALRDRRVAASSSATTPSPTSEDYKPQPFSPEVRGRTSPAGTPRSTRTRTSRRPSPSGSPPAWTGGKRYAGWGALKKLQYVDEHGQAAGPRARRWCSWPSTTSTSSRWRRRSLDHYRQRDWRRRWTSQLRRAPRSGPARPLRAAGCAPAQRGDADPRRAADAHPGRDAVLAA